MHFVLHKSTVYGLFICVILTLIFCLYLIIFKSVHSTKIVPSYPTPLGTNVTSVTDNGSSRSDGGNGTEYFLNLNVIPSAANEWCTFTVKPDYSFSYNNDQNFQVFGRSSPDGTTTSVPVPIMQIVPSSSDMGLTITFFSNSLFNHIMNIRIKTS